MGRPQKLTLDFFLHDVHAASDRKIRRLMRKHGCYGYASYFVLLEKCCLEQGMRLDLSDPEEAELMAETIMLRDCQHLYAIVQFCADIGLFNKQLWEAERIVFSDALHGRYVERLEQRKADATRKRQSRAAKALQEKINALDPELSGVTNGLSLESHKGCPSTEDQKTEDRDQKTEVQKTKNRSAPSDRSITSTEAAVKTDRFFGATNVVRRIEHVASKPRWDANAPWNDDTQRKQFDDWLRLKYSDKKDPARYAQVIVSATAKGEPSVDWEEFKSSSSSNSEVAILADWGKRQDWENFPLLQDWTQKHAEMGVNAFVNLGGRYSPQHRFSDWLMAQEVAC